MEAYQSNDMRSTAAEKFLEIDSNHSIVDEAEKCQGGWLVISVVPYWPFVQIAAILADENDAL